MKKFILGICLVLSLTVNVWAQEIKVETLAKTGASWDGRDLPDYPQGRPEITILRIEIPPQMELAIHKHPVINTGVLIKGELTVRTQENEILHLKAGDSIVEVVEKWHYGINEGNDPAEIIVFYVGVQGSPITVYK